MQTSAPKVNKKRLRWLPQRRPMQRRGSRALSSPRTFRAQDVASKGKRQLEATLEWFSVNNLIMSKQEIKMPALGNQNQKNQ